VRRSSYVLPPLANWRTLLASGPGAIVQLAFFALAILALPSASVLAPLALATLAALMLWLAGDDWPAVGFRAPRRRLAWWVPEALVIGVLWQYAAVGLLAPAFAKWLAGTTPAGPPGWLAALLIYAMLHPFAKALAYRAFLLARLEKLFGQSRVGQSLAYVIASLVFGLGNLYQGWAGVAVGAFTGAVLNALYHWEGRSVWPTVLAHAAFNAAAFTLLYLGGL
jgi:CAAX protease family protein